MHVKHKAGLALAALALAAAHPASAQINTIASFNGANGQYPYGGVTFDSQGNLYGTTYQGGTGGGNSGYGTVFEIKSGSSAITTLASFNNTNGAFSEGGLTFDSLGNLYGTTRQGGTNNRGTVFEIKSGSNAITTLASFNNANGAFPQSTLLFDSLGNLYGTTDNAGPSGFGTVFEVKSGSNAITTLASFNNTIGIGAAPFGNLTFDSLGNLYGTTNKGGIGSFGTVFEIKSGSNALTNLAYFNGANGAAPQSNLIFDSLGNLYGTTYQGGANNAGTVFEVNSGSSIITSVVSFTGMGNLVSNPSSLIFDSQGNLYGTTGAGGASGTGTVFEIPKGSSAITTLAAFNSANGAYPAGAVTFDSQGNLYGTTTEGGTSGYGTVFRLINPNAALTPESSGLANLSGALLALGLAGLVTAVKKRKKNLTRQIRSNAVGIQVATLP